MEDNIKYVYKLKSPGQHLLYEFKGGNSSQYFSSHK